MDGIQILSHQLHVGCVTGAGSINICWERTESNICWREKRFSATLRQFYTASGNTAPGLAHLVGRNHSASLQQWRHYCLLEREGGQGDGEVRAVQVQNQSGALTGASAQPQFPFHTVPLPPWPSLHCSRCATSSQHYSTWLLTRRRRASLRNVALHIPVYTQVPMCMFIHIEICMCIILLTLESVRGLNDCQNAPLFCATAKASKDIY